MEALSLNCALTELRIPAALSNVTGGVTGGLPVSRPLGGLQSLALPTDQLSTLLSEDLSLVIGNLTDTSACTPTAVGAPGTGAGTPSTDTDTPSTAAPVNAARQLPRTGAFQGLAALGVVLMTAAVVTRRRRTEVLDELTG